MLTANRRTATRSPMHRTHQRQQKLCDVLRKAVCHVLWLQCSSYSNNSSSTLTAVAMETQAHAITEIRWTDEWKNSKERFDNKAMMSSLLCAYTCNGIMIHQYYLNHRKVDLHHATDFYFFFWKSEVSQLTDSYQDRRIVIHKINMVDFSKSYSVS